MNPATEATCPESPRSKADDARRDGHGARMPELDGLRGVAILLVMMFHFVGVMPAEWGDRSVACKLLGRLGASAWCGVDLFFVLSGFLITGILHDTKGSRRYLSTFYARRTLRIFPLYYAVLFIVFAVVPWVVGPSDAMRRLQGNQGWFWAYAANVLRVANGTGSCNGPGFSLEHFWSLAVEEHFYLIWPLVILATGRRGVMRACAALAIAATACRVLFILRGDPFAAYMLTPCRVDVLLIGGYLALAIRGADTATVRRWSVAVAATSGLGVAALVARGHGLLLFQDRVVQAAGYPMLGLLFASGVSLAIRPPATSLYGAILRWPALRFFGRYSYGLYVYHFLLNGWFRSAVPVGRLASATGSPFAAVLIHLAFATSVTAAVAWLSWHLFEGPLASLKRFFTYG